MQGLGDLSSLRVVVDPSNVAPVPTLVRERHHADPAVTPVGELRSELVTVLALAGPLLLVGFLAGADHDGTIRAHLLGDRVEVTAEAHLGAPPRPDLSEGEVRAWALAVAASGGMALVSDDLALLDDGARRLLDEVLAVGRAVDADALDGRTPRCADLLDASTPRHLKAAGHVLSTSLDPVRGTLTRTGGRR